MLSSNPFLSHAKVALPVIAGPMYPCSNPELVAAVSEHGGLGVLQPVSLTFVFGHDFRAGLRLIKSLTDKPVGMNALIEKSSSRYLEKMRQWIDIALEEGVRFFITSLGKPDWVVSRVHAAGGVVYHDATESKWALKALESGVDGLIAVNNRAGGHAGEKSALDLFRELEPLNLPLVCAGGVANRQDFSEMMDIGYSAVQMGTRFIATSECSASDAYKQAILRASEQDIVLSEKITGVPVSVIRTPYIEQMGVKSGPIGRFLLSNSASKHLVRMLYTLKSAWQLKRSSLNQNAAAEFWQAGKSAAHIESICSVAELMQELKLSYESKLRKV